MAVDFDQLEKEFTALCKIQRENGIPCQDCGKLLHFFEIHPSSECTPNKGAYVKAVYTQLMEATRKANP